MAGRGGVPELRPSTSREIYTQSSRNANEARKQVKVLESSDFKKNVPAPNSLRHHFRMGRAPGEPPPRRGSASLIPHQVERNLADVIKYY